MVPLSIPADMASSLLALLAPSPGQPGSTFLAGENDAAFTSFSDSLLNELGAPSPNSALPAVAKANPIRPKKNEEDASSLTAATLPVIFAPAALGMTPLVPDKSSSQVAVQTSTQPGKSDAIPAALATKQTAPSGPNAETPQPAAKIAPNQTVLPKIESLPLLTEADFTAAPQVQEIFETPNMQSLDDNSRNFKDDGSNAVSDAAEAISQAQPKQKTPSGEGLISTAAAVTSDLAFADGIDLPTPTQEGAPPVPNKKTANPTNFNVTNIDNSNFNLPASRISDHDSSRSPVKAGTAETKPAGTGSVATPGKPNLEAQLAETLKAHAPLLSATESEKVISTSRENNTAFEDRVSSLAADTKPDKLAKESQAPAPISNTKPSQAKADEQKSSADAKPALNSGFPAGQVSDPDSMAVSPGNLPSSTTSSPTNANVTPAPTQSHAIVEDPRPGLESKTPPQPSPDLPVAQTPSTGSVQTAHLVDQMGQTEMRIGLRTSAFGNVEVHTIVRDAQVGVALGSERGDLKSFLASEVPALQSAFRQQNLRLETIQFTRQGGSLNASFSGGAEQQARSPRPQFLPKGAAANDETSAEAAEVESPVSSWSGLNVHA